MKMHKTLLALCGLLFSATAVAVPLTGDPSPPNPFGWVPNSTNAHNYGMTVPGRVGQVAPHVLFVSNTLGEVTLEFNNGAPGLAFFEIRIDGVDTGVTAHPVVIGDTIHTGGIAVPSGTLDDVRSFAASSMVEVRLALGGERDFDFDWTAFGVASVPEPATLGLAFAGLAGIIATRRRRRLS